MKSFHFLKNNIITFIVIILIVIYHFKILNKIEKIFSQKYFGLDNNFIKRPLKKCINNKILTCIGIPSGHTEAITIFSLLLYHLKWISLPVCILLIIGVGIQRIISNMHTPFQVFIGFLLGLFYSSIYILNNFSYMSFIYIFIITISFITAIIAQNPTNQYEIIR